jgi:shikimate kinase
MFNHQILNQGMLAASPENVDFPFPPDQNIVLVGLMGAGKTTVGRQIARALGRPFVDSDHEIEARMGVPIPTIFEIEGEEGFRRRESQVIADLVQLRGLVLATGGGAVLRQENRQCLHNNGWVVYLNVPPRQLFERTRTDRNRPLLQVADPLSKLQELHAIRDPLYRETAHIVIEGRRMGASSVSQFLIKEFQKHADPDRCAG